MLYRFSAGTDCLQRLMLDASVMKVTSRFHSFGEFDGSSGFGLLHG
jgi:hypothetical protein